jgi:hypothetical protein
MRNTDDVIDDGYLQVARMIDQLRADLDAIREAEPGSEAHRRSITRYSSTYAKIGRSAYTKHVPFPLPPSQSLTES